MACQKLQLEKSKPAKFSQEYLNTCLFIGILAFFKEKNGKEKLSLL